MAQLSLERVNIDKYKDVDTRQMPNKEKAVIKIAHGTKLNEFYAYNVLLDTGSTISVITQNLAKQLIKYLKLKLVKSKSFYVENGGEKDALFSGHYLEAHLLKPLEKRTKIIRLYVMPVSCSYDIIIGMNDMEQLGYGLVCLSSHADDKILYKHKGIVKQSGFISRQSDLMERINMVPTQIKEYQNEQFNEINDDLESSESEDSDEETDGRIH